jgi:hypothetical protein
VSLVSEENAQSADGGAEAAEAAEPAAGGPEAGEAPAFVIPHVLAQATLDYLASQPYREVFALIRGFESLEPLNAPDGTQH